jgi:hypothetical protein
MKNELIQYLKTISMSDALIARIQVVFQECQLICPEELISILVSEYIKDDDTREYEGLWLFSEKFIMEAKQFVTNDDFDLSVIKKNVTYCQITKKDFDFSKSSEKSRLSIQFSLSDNLGCSLKSSKDNCDYLMKIITMHVIPNLKY